MLVVDDDAAKSGAIVDALRDLAGEGEQHSVTAVSSLANAIRLMSQIGFDLIVIDLMLPYVEGGLTDSRAGLELVRQLRMEAGPNKTTAVIGLSAFPDEISNFRTSFDELGVLMIEFDARGASTRALQRVFEDVSARAHAQIDLDFVVICALEEERAGFTRTASEKVSEAIVSGLNVHYIRLAGSPELFGCVVRLSQMGLVAATFEAGSALSAFRTRALAMSGICAGISRVSKLGQLVVASPAWEYQVGKWSKNGFEIAPIQVPLPAGTRSIIDQVIGRDDFARYLEAGVPADEARPARRSAAMLAPVATGSAVIADARRLEHIQKQHRKIAALDMETFGLYFVAHETQASIEHFFSVKCVVDFADSEKVDDLHSYGCTVSARATEQLLRALLVRT
jgi:nucleoside phosphorylase